MLISSVEHWNTSTYLSFIVFLWHFWATINALSGDFIWMKASPEGRPCRGEPNNNQKEGPGGQRGTSHDKITDETKW